MAMIWDLQGTPSQNDIVRSALSRCNFPFDLLLPGLKKETGRSTLPIDWQDLSRYAATAQEYDALEARSRVLGLAWFSGRVTLDLSLESNPELAAEVLLAEIAHMTDFFLMTDEQRRLIYNAMHGSEAGAPEHGHGWFDVGSYETWAGEGFMSAFTRAYSDVPVTIPFDHPPTEYVAQRVREILTPAPLPRKRVFGSRRGSTYHDAHKGVSRDIEWESWAEAEAAGRRACGVCRPS